MIDTAALRKKWAAHTNSITAQCVGCALHAALDEIDRLQAEAHTSSVMVGSPPVRVIADPERAYVVAKQEWGNESFGDFMARMIRTGRLLVVEQEAEEPLPACVVRPAGCGRELFTAIRRHEKADCSCPKGTR